MRRSHRAFVVGIVGPDGSGKSAVASYVVEGLRQQGLRVTHTHGRPQAVAARQSPSGVDPTRPHAGAARNAPLSIAKYLLAAVDFLIFRRRLRGTADVWVAERPLLDYEVDPRRYQLARSTLRLISRLNRVLVRPDVVLFLDGDASAMASRKPELSVFEIDRQLSAWRAFQGRSQTLFQRLSTTDGVSAAATAAAATDLIIRAHGRRWRRAPLKPGRLDIRFTGDDLAALEIYRPIRVRARAAAQIGCLAIRAHLTPAVSAPSQEVTAALQSPQFRACTGIAAMASSTPGRWVLGFARGGELRFVAKVGRSDDRRLTYEASLLRELEERPIDGLCVPRVYAAQTSSVGTVLTTYVDAQALTPLTDIDRAIEIATRLARAGWTHGDLAPWNVFRAPGGSWHLFDWESARLGVEPYVDILHYLLRLGATTHPAEARAALVQLRDGHPRFASLAHAMPSGVQRQDVSAWIGHHLASTAGDDMSSRERRLRHWLAEGAA